jgi:hypothetical protein
VCCCAPSLSFSLTHPPILSHSLTRCPSHGRLAPHLCARVSNPHENMHGSGGSVQVVKQARGVNLTQPGQAGSQKEMCESDRHHVQPLRHGGMVEFALCTWCTNTQKRHECPRSAAAACVHPTRVSECMCGCATVTGGVHGRPRLDKKLSSPVAAVSHAGLPVCMQEH